VHAVGVKPVDVAAMRRLDLEPLGFRHGQEFNNLLARDHFIDQPLPVLVRHHIGIGDVAVAVEVNEVLFGWRVYAK
jgi:hypothetical protein